MPARAIRSALDVARMLAAIYPDAEADDLDDEDVFHEAVSELAESNAAGDELLKLARRRDEPIASCIALAAIAARRTPPPLFETWAWRAFRKTTSLQDVFLFRALTVHARSPAIPKALAVLEHEVSADEVAQFVATRLEAGEPFDASTLDGIDVDIDGLAELVAQHGEQLGVAFQEAYSTWKAGSLQLDGAGGRLWRRPFDSPPALAVGRRADIVELVAAALEETPRRSMLLVGRHGVGKTSLARAAADRVQGIHVLEASAGELQAGAVYVGELEQRAKELLERMHGQPFVLHIPNLEAALLAGQHLRSHYGLLDLLLPAVAAGELTVLAEATPEGAERLLSERPQLSTLFGLVQVRPLEERDAVAVALHALEHDGYDIDASAETLHAAFALAEGFLPRIASPGNLLRLVRAATADGSARGATQLEHSDLVSALAGASGLPLHLLDASVALDLADVRSFFESRILGQEEAVAAVVERIALVKAGLTDPTRPLGVFLFVGPTGTGKTEIAKALAEFLFGSPDRLVRLDMTEFQTADSFDRLLADTSIDTYGAPLVAAIRRDPFSVVLLDEFDKSAKGVWDLFLQAFDDGRLTDSHGRAVDLRQCVFVLTSNMGAAIATRPGVGFEKSVAPFSAADVNRELERSFRPEFLNRIDRIVVFRPFERSQMRALLEYELARALSRRGLRERPWAIELDDSAYEFLIEQGFSPALGARPLKRALERHLLVPLAAAIVEHRTPSGDQFLLVSAPGGTRIEVTFVDPDAEDPREPGRDADATLAGELDLRSLALVPRSDPAHTAFLLDEVARIAEAVRSSGAPERKEAGLLAMQSPEFWESDDRHAVLAEIEYVDRLETALGTAERLGARLRHATMDAGAQLHGIVARRLYVLDQALRGLATGAPTDVFVRMRGVGSSRPELADFPLQLAAMYEGWAERCGMRVERLTGDDGEQLLAVSGLGCGEILAHEAGHHVLETAEPTDDGRKSDRATVLVDIAPWEPAPSSQAADPLDQARRAFAGSVSSTTVVRRYRLEPDPLVRDAVRGYRTGRADRVLAGDFDLF
jgi:ATP-dependent Clp protease ATP-binding subunit ClpC